MELQELIDPNFPSAISAPFWFVQFFKVLGFTLHAALMSLWYVGLPVALVLAIRGGEHGRRLSSRLAQQMPVIVAFGVNFGIVPLLFIQLAYAKVFYPATILMAWFWLAVIALLIPAYYGVYAYAFGVRNTVAGASGNGGQNAGMPLWRQAAGWIAMLFFLAIGFIFANALTLMVHLESWPGLWQKTQYLGAVTGLALNLSDARLWPRWLLMIGLAIMTTAVWTLVDAVLFVRQNADDYRRWVERFAFGLYIVGAVWFAVAGSWYAFGTWIAPVREVMWALPTVVLTALTAVSPGVVIGLLVLARYKWEAVSAPLALAVAAGQLLVLALNATSRQIVQNVELGQVFAVGEQPVNVQWSPAFLFLGTFVLGLGVLAWMLWQVFKVGQAPAQSNQ